MAKLVLILEALIDSSGFTRVGLIYLIVNAAIGAIIFMLAMVTNVAFLLTLLLKNKIFLDLDEAICAELCFQVFLVSFGPIVTYFCLSTISVHYRRVKIPLGQKMDIFTPIPSLYLLVLLSCTVIYIYWTFAYVGISLANMGRMLFYIDIIGLIGIPFIICYIFFLSIVGFAASAVKFSYILYNCTYKYEEREKAVAREFKEVLVNLLRNFDQYSRSLPKHADEVVNLRIIQNGRKLLDFVVMIITSLGVLQAFPLPFIVVESMRFGIRYFPPRIGLSPISIITFVSCGFLAHIILCTDWGRFVCLFVKKPLFLRGTVFLEINLLMMCLYTLNAVTHNNISSFWGKFYINSKLLMHIFAAFCWIPLLYLLFVRYRKMYRSLGDSPDEWNAKELLRYDRKYKAHDKLCAPNKYPMIPRFEYFENRELIRQMEDELVQRQENYAAEDERIGILPESCEISDDAIEIQPILEKGEAEKGKEEEFELYYFQKLDDEGPAAEREPEVKQDQFASVWQRHPVNQFRARTLFLYMTLLALLVLMTGFIAIQAWSQNLSGRAEPILFIIFNMGLRALLYIHTIRNLGDNEDFIFIYVIYVPLSLILTLWDVLLNLFPHAICCFMQYGASTLYCDIRSYLVPPPEIPTTHVFKDLYVISATSETELVYVMACNLCVTLFNLIVVAVAAAQDVFAYYKLRVKRTQEEDTKRLF